MEIMIGCGNAFFSFQIQVISAQPMSVLLPENVPSRAASRPARSSQRGDPRASLWTLCECGHGEACFFDKQRRFWGWEEPAGHGRAVFFEVKEEGESSNHLQPLGFWRVWA